MKSDMKRVALLTAAALLVIYSSTTMIHAEVPTPAVEKEVMAAMNAASDALAQRDAAALQRLFHDELEYSHSDNRHQSKSYLVNEASNGRGPGSVHIMEPTVHVYGNTAIIRGKAGTPGRPVPETAPHVLAVLVKGPSGWQLVARTATRTPQPGEGRGARGR